LAAQFLHAGKSRAGWELQKSISGRLSTTRVFVKVEDPRRAREVKQFGIVLCILFALVMGYALQHFRAIEYGYQIESLRSQRDGLQEMNRALRLEEASLRDPERIDVMARKLGLQSPQPGQVMHLDVDADAGTPVMASVTPISVVSAR